MWDVSAVGKHTCDVVTNGRVGCDECVYVVGGELEGANVDVKDADIIYAKSWGAMVHTPDPDEGAKIIKKYESWITDERRMALAKGDAIYMHPLPADRNIEVMDAVIDGAQSVVYDEAENRLHVQKAVMALTM